MPTGYLDSRARGRDATSSMSKLSDGNISEAIRTGVVSELERLFGRVDKDLVQQAVEASAVEGSTAEGSVTSVLTQESKYGEEPQEAPDETKTAPKTTTTTKVDSTVESPDKYGGDPYTPPPKDAPKTTTKPTSSTKDYSKLA